MADPAGRETPVHLLSQPDLAALIALATQLQHLALARGMTVGTAESCSGGLVGHSITSVPGSSGYYLGGVVSYADSTKVGLIGVPLTTLERHGAVSAQTAVAMAEGVRERLGCDVAVAVTGVAGPDGGTAAKPVGLTYVATAGPAGHDVQRRLWDGDRAANKEQSAAAALEMLISVLAAAGATAEREDQQGAAQSQPEADRREPEADRREPETDRREPEGGQDEAGS